MRRHLGVSAMVAAVVAILSCLTPGSLVFASPQDASRANLTGSPVGTFYSYDLALDNAPSSLASVQDATILDSSERTESATSARISPSRVASVVGAETGASAASRVEQLQGVLDPIAQNSRTSAVLNTQEGIDVLASGGRDLSPAQRALANEGDLLARMPGAHAEVTALEGAFKAGLSPSEMAVSRLICPECQAFIENSGGTISPGGTGATWP